MNYNNNSEYSNYLGNKSKYLGFSLLKKHLKITPSSQWIHFLEKALYTRPCA